MANPKKGKFPGSLSTTILLRGMSEDELNKFIEDSYDAHKLSAGKYLRTASEQDVKIARLYKDMSGDVKDVLRRARITKSKLYGSLARVQASELVPRT